MGLNILPVKRSFMESFRNFDLKGMVQAVKDLNLNWIEMATFVVAGIVVGFIFTRYFKDILFAVFIIIAATIFFEYVGLITIQWECIQGVFGQSPIQAAEVFCRSVYVIIWSNIPLVISFILGFFIGVKVG